MGGLYIVKMAYKYKDIITVMFLWKFFFFSVSPACLCYPKGTKNCIFIIVFSHVSQNSCCETEIWCLSIQSENIKGESGKFKEPTLERPDFHNEQLQSIWMQFLTPQTKFNKIQLICNKLIKAWVQRVSLLRYKWL